MPASTSNLGPGFDAIGLALALYLRLDVTLGDAGEHDRVTWDFGDGAPHGDNLIARAFDWLVTRHGGHVPALHVSVVSEIPQRSGLGSSAAAIVAGVRLYHAVCRRVPPDEQLDVAATLEGHPDNTSAALLGGLTTSTVSEDGHVIAVASRWPDHIGVVIATPQVALDTTSARAVLPDVVSHHDAVFNVQRVALLLHALHAGRRDALAAALGDRLHQTYRASLVPGLYDALQFRHATLIGVFLSGAGPSIAALIDGDPGPVRAFFDNLYRRLALPCTVRTLAVHQPADAQGVAFAVTRAGRAPAPPRAL